MKEQSEKSFFDTITKMLTKIYEKRQINRFVLARELGMTARQYERLHPYLEEGYKDQIQFDDESKVWTYIGKEIEN